MHRLILGSRGSKLALCQTEIAAEHLRALHPNLELDVKIIQTAGDRDRSRPIAHFGDKGVFVRAIEEALLSGEIDLAVHSLKDVPGDQVVPGLVLAAFSKREDPRDVLISHTDLKLDSLPAGARVGTSSPRRRVQLRAIRPDLVAEDIRGNVDTRLGKVQRGELDAIVLAAAGLHRLGLSDAITEYLPYSSFLPDAGQGIMAVQVRRGSEAEHLASTIDHPDGRAAATAERAVARALEADCRSPIGALAEIEGDRITLQAIAASADGTRLERLSQQGTTEDAEQIGTELGLKLARLLAQAGSYTGP